MVRVLKILVIVVLFAVSAWAGPSEDATLREAVRNVDIVAVKSILKKGANPNVASSGPNPRTMLEEANLGILGRRGEDAHSKVVEIVKLLFSSGAKIGIYDRSILFFPIAEGNVQLVALLLDHGASPTTAKGCLRSGSLLESFW